MALSPHAADVIYRHAVVLALAGRVGESLAALQSAVDQGYSRTMAKDDDDLAILRGRPQFAKLIGETVAVLRKGERK